MSVMAAVLALAFYGGGVLHPVVAQDYAPQSMAQPMIGSWVVYDGYHITTEATCIARVNALKQYYPTDRFQCGAFYTQSFPITKYWMVLIYQQGGAIVVTQVPRALTC